jgi:hypothetical protein
VQRASGDSQRGVRPILMLGHGLAENLVKYIDPRHWGWVENCKVTLEAVRYPEAIPTSAENDPATRKLAAAPKMISSQWAGAEVTSQTNDMGDARRVDRLGVGGGRMWLASLGWQGAAQDWQQGSRSEG